MSFAHHEFPECLVARVVATSIPKISEVTGQEAAIVLSPKKDAQRTSYVAAASRLNFGLLDLSGWSMTFFYNGDGQGISNQQFQRPEDDAERPTGSGGGNNDQGPGH
eukprot:8193021-Karenia_brevis.AAC.1